MTTGKNFEGASGYLMVLFCWRNNKANITTPGSIGVSGIHTIFKRSIQVHNVRYVWYGWCLFPLKYHLSPVTQLCRRWRRESFASSCGRPTIFGRNYSKVRRCQSFRDEDVPSSRRDQKGTEEHDDRQAERHRWI